LTRALAQRDWVGPRIRDWLKLAPELGLCAESRPASWLLCADFGPETRAAHRALSDDGLGLARIVWGRVGANPEVRLEPVEGNRSIAREPAREAAPEERKPSAPFRSGLRDDDFDLSEAERRAFLTSEKDPIPSG
jgi:hypothetical protein